MVKIMENPIKMGDLGGTTIFGNTQVDHVFSSVLWNTPEASNGAHEEFERTAEKGGNATGGGAN